MTDILNVVVRKEDGLYVAHCTETGITSQGRTEEDAIINLIAATDLYQEEFTIRVKTL
mgnify:CR=1 FL=1